MPVSFLGQSSLTRGLRNNNPGNIRRSSSAWQGKIPHTQSTDTAFEQFASIEWGIRAMYKLLINYSNDGLNTVQKIINKYAPASENNTAGYIAFVIGRVGVSATSILTMNKSTLIALAKAMVTMEIGQDNANKIPDHCYDDAYLYLDHTYGSTTLPELEIKGTTKCQHCGQIIVGIALFFFTWYANFI